MLEMSCIDSMQQYLGYLCARVNFKQLGLIRYIWNKIFLQNIYILLRQSYFRNTLSFSRYFASVFFFFLLLYLDNVFSKHSALAKWVRHPK